MNDESDHDLTRQERREERAEKERKFRADNRRSVRIQAALSARPPKRRRRR